MFIRYQPAVVQIMALLLAMTISSSVTAEDKPTGPQQIKHQVTGLFCPAREADLQKTCAELTDIKLIKIDYPNAEAVFEYDPAKVFPNTKPEQLIEQFDNKLKAASNHTFGIKALRTLPREKLKYVEISVAGLDCKACSLAAYEAVYQLKGVEQATASFKDRLVTAWIDPEKTDRVELEMALKNRGVTLPTATPGTSSP